MTSIRTLHLIRHGNYIRRKPASTARLRVDAANRQLDGGLTELGRDQAKRTARRLLDLKLTAMHSSTLPRALQTAELLMEALDDGLPFHTSDGLWECIPHLPSAMAARGLTEIEEEDLEAGRARAEAAFDRYFAPGEEDAEEVVVCHGNLIRYFVARVLRVELDAWARMRTHHCGISTVLISSDGQMRLVSYNDTGHLPYPMVTS